MATVKQNEKGEAEIRALFEERVKAVRVKDVESLLAGYASDVLSFDVVDPLQYVGAKGIRTRMEEWFATFQGAIGIDNRNLSIVAGEDVAYCHSLSHVSATTRDGSPLDMWWRETVCYRKFDDKWLITHQHSSVPFNVESGKASLDLKP